MGAYHTDFFVDGDLDVLRSKAFLKFLLLRRIKIFQEGRVSGLVIRKPRLLALSGCDTIFGA